MEIEILNPEDIPVHNAEISETESGKREREEEEDIYDGKEGGSVSLSVTSHQDENSFQGDYVPASEFTPQRSRANWPEKRLLKLLEIYISEHPVYLKAKVERQISEFHEYIGQMVNTEGVLVAGLLKNLSREYRKMWNRCGGMYPEEGMKLRGSHELYEKFEKYYQLYNKVGLNDSWKTSAGKSRKSSSSSPLTAAMPKIKKLKKAVEPMRQIPGHDQSPTAFGLNVPGMTVLPNKYSQEYLDLMREQTRALVEIGKELRLMRMGYFTEHELAMDQ